LFNVTDVTATTFLLTVTAQVAVLSPAAAVMVAEPSATAVTIPEDDTVATEGFELLHVTVLSVALSGLTVATSVSLSPSVKDSALLFNVTDVTATTFLLTVTAQVAVLSPAAAVMVAEPSATAVTIPEDDTVATEGLELLHVTLLSVALSGLTVTTSVSLSPSFKDKDVLFSLMDVTCTDAGVSGLHEVHASTTAAKRKSKSE